IALPRPEPLRWQASIPLNLAQLNVKPGDTVKVFARAEDSDPLGPKGAESPVATIKIISQKEMERIQLAQEAMEILQSKYDEAARRLEALDQQIEKLQKELQKLDPNSELAQEKHDQLNELAERMDKEAAAVEKAAKQDLPFDIDRALSKQLDPVAEKMRDAA